jgi:hypothetical protein
MVDDTEWFSDGAIRFADARHEKARRSSRRLLPYAKLH